MERFAALKFQLKKLSAFHWISLLLLTCNLVLAMFPDLLKPAAVEEPKIDYADIVTIDPSFTGELDTMSGAEPGTEEKAETPAGEPADVAEAEVINRQEQFLCYELGPAENESERDYFEETLAAYNIGATREVRQIQEIVGHWVFLPPLRSRALGRLKVEELKLKGIKDVVLLTKNEPKFAISLGVYKDKKYANRRLLKIQSIGYNAEMGVRHKTVDQHWLQIKTNVNDDLNEMTWSALIQDYGHIQLLSVDCN